MNVVLVDDIDGSAASETVTFALDGVSYEVDLSEDNAARLRSSLTEFVDKGRRAGGSRSKGTRSASRSSSSSSLQSGGGVDNGAVREWARANGHAVSERGRIKADVVQAYQAANG
ncbi:histone-like nucleoid-structuring protein Lsr2 [Aquipuribacter hungaricus]|uniref:Lsr2 family protein n=1 Tax=Aquipuribacter hungaricus TaxID=545624 RepID=A0ABV7WCX9_9MICO